jgi:hypothetical protein
MRTSLNEIKKIELFLLARLSPPESLLFEARILTNPILRMNVVLQQKIYTVVRAYHRKQLKIELKAIQRDLFSDPNKRDFQQTIRQHFQP